ncbi:MAG TPA: flagellar M-ring protein FliF [Alphaproteobacteria bacterium]|nr:flagellar M-ring protein FliF [Alphaproteobacteria bacterium]
MRNLGPVRLAIMGVVLVGLAGFFIFLTSRLNTGGMELLYADLDQTDSTRITTQLQSQGVKYELKSGGSQIMVPSDQVGPIRLSLASQGLPSGGTVGYEIFDKAESLGTTNFMQNINLVRALEGELSRTISSIASVRSARVHLVMPRRQLFSREKQQPSASIVLRMAGAVRLNKEQIAAIQYVVAAAVPELTPDRISIIDTRGSLLARGFDSNGPAALAAKDDEQRIALEQRLGRTIEDLLGKTVGLGKVRAEVQADMNFDRVSTSEEQYNPDGQVVRSTQSSEQSNKSNDSESSSPVSVATNLPDATAGNGGGPASSSTENSTNETVNYEISKKVINSVRKTGTIKRLSVAVLVDGTYSEDKQGKRTYKPRPQDEMELLATLVRSAIGFNADRGDSVDVINMRFAPIEITGEKLKLFFGLEKKDLLRMAEILVLSIVAILVILLVVRPLVSRAFEAIPAGVAALGEEGRLLAGQAGATALAGPGGIPAPAGAPKEASQYDELIDIDRIEGQVKASSVKKVGEIVEKHPAEALSIVRSWLYQEN